MTEDRRYLIHLLYQKYYRELVQYSLSLFDYQPHHQQDAEDCVQETFEKALRHENDMQTVEEPLFFLRKMCYHITITKRRNIHNQERILGFPGSLQECNPPDSRDLIGEWLQALENTQNKQALLRQLTSGERAVYEAYYEQHLSLQDTARTLDISTGSVRGAAQRIRKKAAALKFLGI